MQTSHRSIFSTYIFGFTFAINHLPDCFYQKFSMLQSRYFVIALLIISNIPLFGQAPLSQSRAERLFQKGSELVVHSNFGAARKVFSDFLLEASPTDPRRAEAEYYIAYSALNMRNTDGEKLIADFVSRYPSSPRAATAYYDLANFFFGEGNHSKAIQYFKKVDFPALTLDQQNHAHFNWGYSYFNLKKLDEALEQFNFVKKLNSIYAPASNYYAGFIEYTQGKYDDALTDLKRAEKSSSYSAVVPYLIANVFYRQQAYDQLIEYAASVTERADLQNRAEISMLVAEAHYFKKAYDEAVAAYDQYLGDNPRKAQSPVLFRAGFANYSVGQPKKAIEYLTHAASGNDTTRFYASYYLGILYLKQAEPNLALNAFEVAARVPNNDQLAEEAAFQFAKVLYDAGYSERAIDRFEAFLKAYPRSQHSVEARELLAQAYINGDNYHKAIEYIESLPSRSKHINQAYQKATFLLGAELFNKNRYADAVANFEKSLRYPEDPLFVAKASYWAGESYSIGRKYDQAIKHYEKVVSLGSSVERDLMLKTRYALGYAHFNLKAYAKALLHFREFVNNGNRSTPNYADGLIRLADCYYDSKQYTEALATYTRARNLGTSDNDYVLLQTGVISGIQRKYAESRELLTTLIRNYPKSQYRDEALYQRAQFEVEQGNARPAIEGFSQLIREEKNSPFLPYAYMRRAAAHYNLKEYDQTIEDYSTILQLFPTHAISQEVLLPLQEALTVAGRSGEFDTYLAQFKTANPDNKGLESIEFETGKNLFFDQQYQKAIASLGRFLEEYPESARASEAKYYIAESHYRVNDFAKALPLYLELSNDPTFMFGSRVVGRAAELQFRENKYEEAIRNFHRLEAMATNKRDQGNAWMGLMESFYLLGQYDSADTYANIIIEKGAVNASAQNKASLYLGKTALARGDYESAKDEFLNTLNAAEDEYGAEAKYLLGYVQYLEKNYQQSYETLLGLNKDFSSYEEWVGRSFLLIADLFIAQDNFFQAKATLQSLIDHFPLQHIRDQARVKLTEAERMEAIKQQQAKPDTIETLPDTLKDQQ